MRAADQPTRWFLDFLSLRQCVNDFAIHRVRSAIATIGITIVELGTDWEGPEALLKRLFCVIEASSTIAAKGILLVAGPALQDEEEVQKLLRAATSREKCTLVMDSRNNCKCRWEDEAKKIRGFIEKSVGYTKTDRQVLSMIASGCLERVLPTMEAQGKSDEAASMVSELADMLLETEVSK